MAVWVPWRLRLRTEMQELGGLPGLTPLSWLARQISSRRVGCWILDVAKTSMRRDGDLLARLTSFIDKPKPSVPKSRILLRT